MKFSRHAAERYVERVRPGLTVAAAAVELERLVPEMTRQQDQPEWSGMHDRVPAYWLMLGEDISFPVINGIAATCIVRGTLAPATRRARSERNAARRRGRRGRKIGPRRLD